MPSERMISRKDQGVPLYERFFQGGILSVRGFPYNSLGPRGSLPLDIRIREQADSGRPTVVADPDGKVAAMYREIARKTAVAVAQKAEDFSARFPSIVIQNT